MNNHELDLEEQEQIANLKAFWSKYGQFIISVVISVSLILAAYNGWRYWQTRQASQAAVLFEATEKALLAQDLVQLKTVTGQLLSDYKSTVYASKAALLSARAFVASEDLKQAKAQLNWVIDHGYSESYRAAAQIRLAGVLLDEKAYDQALKVLQTSVPDGFKALQADRRGDVLWAKGDVKEAQTAYEFALTQFTEKDPWRDIVRQKLEAIAQ
jgi:predicted negative regulator of RcsB-dependent stress response